MPLSFFKFGMSVDTAFYLRKSVGTAFYLRKKCQKKFLSKISERHVCRHCIYMGKISQRHVCRHCILFEEKCQKNLKQKIKNKKNINVDDLSKLTRTNHPVKRAEFQ